MEADLFVIGPEQPLVDGLADRLRAAGRRVFGPDADGARLEGSKAYMKDLLAGAGVPTARYGAFDDAEAGGRASCAPCRASTWSRPTAWRPARACWSPSRSPRPRPTSRAKLAGTSFGAAGRTVVIEEGLRGPEASVFAVCDGTRAVALPPAQDFKRVGDGDTGPNTGGMGAWSPVPLGGPDLAEEVLERFVAPTLAALRAQGIDYRGVLYAGLMLTPEGPKLIEYNIRFGDPDSQVVLMRLTSDLADLLAAAADGDLPSAGPVEASDDALVLVVAASEGYPASPRTGDRIEGLDAAGRGRGGRGALRRGGPRRGRPPGHRRRPGARRDRPGTGCGHGAGAGLPGPGPHLLARDAPPHRHRRRLSPGRPGRGMSLGLRPPPAPGP